MHHERSQKWLTEAATVATAVLVLTLVTADCRVATTTECFVTVTNETDVTVSKEYSVAVSERVETAVIEVVFR